MIGVATYSNTGDTFVLNLEAPEAPSPSRRQLTLSVDAKLNQPVAVETSTNLVDWVFLRALSLGETNLFFTPVTNEPQRFFRAR